MFYFTVSVILELDSKRKKKDKC